MQSRNPQNEAVIDVSKWQYVRSPIIWSEVIKDPLNIKGVIARASYGADYADPKFETIIAGATGVGLWVGAYHYARFGSSVAAAKKEAAFFKSLIKGKKLRFVGLDIEEGSGDLTTACLAFLAELEDLGIELILYTGASFAKKLGKALAKYPLWVAHYGVNTPMANDTWNEWLLFQYTSSGKIRGIDALVDVNEMVPQVSPSPIPAPTPTPGPKVDPVVPAVDKPIAKVRVIADHLNIRVAPDVHSDIVRVSEKGEVFDVYANVNDWHNLGGANWAFGNNGTYLELVKDTPVPTPKPPTPKPAAKTYTVVSGDNLTKIAQKFGTTVAALKSLNGLKSDLIYPGQVLKVTAGSSAPAPKVTPVLVKKKTHKVVSGDTLSEIASANDTTVAKLKALNGLHSDLIKVGQVLKLN